MISSQTKKQTSFLEQRTSTPTRLLIVERILISNDEQTTAKADSASQQSTRPEKKSKVRNENLNLQACPRITQSYSVSNLALVVSWAAHSPRKMTSVHSNSFDTKRVKSSIFTPT